MRVPLQVTFRGMNRSEAIEAKVVERAQKLDRFFQRITACHVVIEAPSKHHNKGQVFHVSIQVDVPGDELVVSRDRGDLNHAHEDVYVAIRDAFEAMVRQVEDYAEKRRVVERAQS